jgi:hypothetical protein
VFVERLWRSVKYEEVYLKAYDTVAEARASLSRYLTFSIVNAPIRALTARRQTRPTSPRYPSRQPHEISAALKPGRMTLIKTRKLFR